MASRQGQVPKGWSKQGVVLPDPVWRGTQSLAERHGYGSLKPLATAAFGVLVGMPDHYRLALLRWIAQAQIDGAESITPEAIWAELERVRRADLGNAQVLGPAEAITPGVPLKPLPAPRGELPLPTPETHQVTRILDPAILKGKKKGGAA